MPVKKKLKDSCVKNIFETIVQGAKLNTLKLNDIISDDSTLESQNFKNSENVLGKDIKLPTSNVKLKITVKDIKATMFKTFILELSEEVKKNLVAGLDFSKIEESDIATILKAKTGKGALDELNKISVTTTPGNTGFFKGKFEILKNGEEGDKIATDNGNVVNDFEKGGFYILKNIKKENINPKYLKKTFEVKLDSNDPKKTVPSETTNELNNFLKEKFGDLLKFTTSEIWAELIKKTTIIKTSFTGKIKIGKGTSNPDEKALNDTSNLVDVDTTEFVIKLPEDAFANNVVQSTIALTFNTDDIKKNNKELKDEIKNAIKAFMKNKNTKTAQNTFVSEFKGITGLEMADSTKCLEVADFDFSQVSNSGNNNIDKSGTISLKANGIEKLADKCFKDAPKPKTNNSSSSSSDGSGDKKGSTGGCCCKGKNNAQKEDKKDKKS